MTGGETASDPATGWKRLLVYADENGTSGPHLAYAGFGSLWVPWERRGDLLRVTREVRDAHGYGSAPINAHESKSEPFVLALIDEIFRRRWIAVRCVVVPLFGRLMAEETREAAFSTLIAARLRSLPGGLEGRDLRLRTSGRPPRNPERLARVERRIAESARFPETLTRSIRPAKTEEGVDLANLLVELIVESWERHPIPAHRKRLAARVAENLGWADLTADTLPSEWKLNIAYLPDPTLPTLPSQTQRSVQLRLPLVD